RPRRQPLAGLCVERDEMTIGGAAEDPPIQIADTAVAAGRKYAREMNHVAPTQSAGHRIEGVGGPKGGGVKRPPHLQYPAIEIDGLVELDLADLFELLDVPRAKLVEIDVALAGVVLVDRDPVVGSRPSSVAYRRAVSPARDRVCEKK